MREGTMPEMGAEGRAVREVGARREAGARAEAAGTVEATGRGIVDRHDGGGPEGNDRGEGQGQSAKAEHGVSPGRKD
jgi:hypothetical protein